MTAMHYADGIGPFRLDSDPRWRWKAYGYAVDGHFSPYRLEVRFKGGPCEHDTPPEGVATWANAREREPGGLVIWEPSACTCWDGLDKPPERAELPPGGLSSRQLREIRLGAAQARLQEMAGGIARWDLWAPDQIPGANAFNREVGKLLEAADQPRAFAERGPGRPALGPEVHVRRLAKLAAIYDAGGKQATAAKRLRISVQTLRATLEWGRRNGLWSNSGRGSRGELTEPGRAAVAALPPAKEGRK